MKIQTIFASLLAFGLVSVANAKQNAAAPIVKQTSFVQLATQPLLPARASSNVAAPVAEQFSCTPKGGACYQDDSWTCCSNICIDSLCH